MGQMRQMQHEEKGIDPDVLLQRGKFLEAISAGSTVCDAVKAAGVSRATVYRWRDEDRDFATAWFDAWEDYVDSLEAMARKRVLSDTMLLRLLAAYRPAKFGDGKPRETRPSPEETPEQLRERIAREMERKRAEVEARADAGDVLAQLQLADADITGLGTRAVKR